MWISAKRELKIFLALLAALFTVTALDVFYVLSMGGVFFLTGVPTPGGAPIGIHVLNFGIKGGWAALAYGLVMRVAFGSMNPMRLFVLWVIGLAIILLLGTLAATKTLEMQSASFIGMGLFLVIGQLIARDWVSR